MKSNKWTRNVGGIAMYAVAWIHLLAAGRAEALAEESANGGGAGFVLAEPRMEPDPCEHVELVAAPKRPNWDAGAATIPCGMVQTDYGAGGHEDRVAGVVQAASTGLADCAAAGAVRCAMESCMERLKPLFLGRLALLTWGRNGIEAGDGGRV